MSASASAVRWDEPLSAYERQAELLYAAIRIRDKHVLWRVKWEHPRFHGRSIAEVHDASLDIDDARAVVASMHHLDGWSALERFTELVAQDETIARFERAADAVVGGDDEALRTMLGQDPALVHARSARRHRATLLHYVAANGVEDARQRRTPPNAVQIAMLLLDAGAEVDALAEMYEAQCTTMSMLVSSAHPAAAGLQVALAELLVDRGAALEGAGSKWTSPLLTALQFGYQYTAQALAARGAPSDTLPIAAGLGRADDVARLLPTSTALERHQALALAAQHGHTAVVQMLLDAGEDPNRINPDGFHSHSTPLHQAVASEEIGVVRLLAQRGARLDVRDTIFDGTPLDWATYLGRTEIASLLAGYDEGKGNPNPE